MDPVKVFDFFGVPEDLQTPSLLIKLKTGWSAHSTTFISIIHIYQRRQAQQAYTYWVGLSDNSTTFEIAKYARYHLLRPISSAAAERIFSYLTHMDTSRRRRMKKKLWLAWRLFVA